MIDHEAAADLWERYKRGERGMFTPPPLHRARARRRSTKSAASTAPIPSSGRPSSNISTSSSGCSTTSSRGDRGPAVVRNYLTSDTGKVYTMLAHAAGRFDQ